MTDASVPLAPRHADVWMRALTAGGAMSANVVRMPGYTGDPPSILRRTTDGVAWGRYVGELLLDGERLRLGSPADMSSLVDWVRAAVDLDHAPMVAGEDPTALLLGLIWAHAVDGASRHGPPAFRRPVPYVGSTVRGHLDVRATVRLRAKGASDIASLMRARDLDNPVTRIIVAADRVLGRQIGHTRWRTDRVANILPQLHVAVGRRAAVPGDGELARMRYTPITRPFKWAAELSARIVRQDVVTNPARPGRVSGLVIDVLDVRRQAVIEWARAVVPGLRFTITGDVIHASSGDSRHLSLPLADLSDSASEAAAVVIAAVRHAFEPATASGSET